MDDYAFHAVFPNDKGQLVIQGYEEGEYDTGYFSMDEKDPYINSKGVRIDAHNSATVILSKT